MSRVSVLVAAYNAERYLPQCLDSLLAQTHTDVQVVCVDDASTDATPAILADYARRDPRVVVTTLRENGGQAHARNMGLALADGDYICMLDSDDWMSADALERAAEVLDTCSDTDSVLFQVVEVYDDHERRYPLPSFSRMSGAEAFEASLTWRLHGLYMVRAAIHKACPYDETSRSYSDDNTTRIHYLRSRHVRQCEGIYYYRQHGASVTHGVTVGRFDYLRANESMLRQMREAGVEDRLISVYERVRWLNLIDVYMFYFKYRNRLTAAECRYGLSEMRRVWTGIDTQRLPMRLRLKPGYMPLRPWWLFRAQEEVYFSLRKWLGKLP